MKLKTEQELSCRSMATAIESKRRDAVDRPAPPHAKLLSEPSSKPFVMGGKTKAARDA
jgi:hypothetical protein